MVPDRDLNPLSCIIVVMTDDADRFRAQADEARRQAEKAISPLDKKMRG
jgi:hypothetical protein